MNLSLPHHSLEKQRIVSILDEAFEVVDRNFWRAKTMKPPFLNKQEAEKLLEAVKTTLG